MTMLTPFMIGPARAVPTGPCGTVNRVVIDPTIDRLAIQVTAGQTGWKAVCLCIARDCANALI